MDAVLAADLEDAKRCLLDTMELVVLMGDEDHKDPPLFLNLMKQLCEIRHESECTNQALELAEEEKNIDDFERVYKTEYEKKVKNFNAKKTAEYKAFAKRTEEIFAVQEKIPAGNVNGDEIEMEGDINIFDPITKQRMQNPVRNKSCGHHYEESTIKQSIKVNKRLRCPVAGCGNKNFVEEKHLIFDTAFKNYLMKLPESSN